MEGKVCTKCGVWKVLDEFNKKKTNKDGRQYQCRECQKEYKKQYRETNKEKIKEKDKQYRETNKEKIKERNKRYREANREQIKERNKQYYEKNKEQISKKSKVYNEKNKEHKKEYNKQWREKNREEILKRKKIYNDNNKNKMEQWRKRNEAHIKEYTERYNNENKELILERARKRREKERENNKTKITRMLCQLNPILDELNIEAYGSIYKITNTKTGHVYIGQTIQPLKRRYKGGVVRGWIKERLKYNNQKFIDELIEEDFEVIEILDVAFCQYHLDKLEAYYIDKYDSFLNGYNNQTGNHDTDDGIEEFNQILSDHNLEFKDGKLIQIKAPTIK